MYFFNKEKYMNIKKLIIKTLSVAICLCAGSFSVVIAAHTAPQPPQLGQPGNQCLQYQETVARLEYQGIAPSLDSFFEKEIASLYNIQRELNQYFSMSPNQGINHTAIDKCYDNILNITKKIMDRISRPITQNDLPKNTNIPAKFNITSNNVRIIDIDSILDALSDDLGKANVNYYKSLKNNNYYLFPTLEEFLKMQPFCVKDNYYNTIYNIRSQ
ncbi:MAG: hypothetical protein LBH49_02515 [Puniceicoccales bacterium]|jgi:hypothetical protein|nr:hypothetical protein [Puniceicoccales bacterium]